MADTTALKNRIRAAIKQNDNQEITGPVLQQTLLDIVDELSDRIIDEYGFIGVAIPSTVPPSDLTEYSRVFYLAAQNGVYTNLGGVEVSGEIVVIKYNGANWSKESCASIDDKPTAVSKNLVESGGVFDELYEPKIDGDDSSVTFEQTARYKANISLSLAANKSYRLKFAATGLTNTDIDNLLYLRTSTSTSYQTYTKQYTFSSEQKQSLKTDGYCWFDVDTEIATSYLHLWFTQNYTPTSGNSITITRYAYFEKYAKKDGVTEIQTLLSQGYIFKGFAIPSTTPPAGNIGRIFYITTQAGTYLNFNELVVNNGCLGILYYDTEWHVSNIVAQNSIINVNDIDNHPSTYLTISTARGEVPSSIRHTGQIIAFYAKNKWFVQLCKDATNWSDDASWVDLLYTNDESAIEGSKNPITSGGAFNELYTIESIQGDSTSDEYTTRFKIVEFDVDAGKDFVLTMNLSGLTDTDIDNIRAASPIVIYDGSTSSSPAVWSSENFSIAIKTALKASHKYEVTVPALQTAGNHISLWFSTSYIPTSGNSISFSIEYKIKKPRYLSSGDYYTKTEVDSKFEAEDLKQLKRIIPTNVWGDILPPMFKSKLMAYDKDLLIVCQGDSLTGKINTADANPNAAISCPGGGYNSWVKLLQDIVNKDKIDWRRLDASIDSSDFFTKAGTWVWTPYSELDDGMDNRYLESSSAADTFRSASASASVAFEFDGSKYDKCNIIFSKSLNATTNATISITEGNGRMLVSLDRETWVEANGFTHSQFTTSANTAHDYGVARQERHRRLWMKKVEGVTGTLHITYSATNTNDSYFYCWGVEMYKGVAVLFDNIGRGGRTSFLLSFNISDVFDRKPDLLIYEMPFANEQGEGTINAQGSYDYWTYPYFVSENGDTGSGRGGTAVSYRVQSADYTTLPVIFLLPHNRASDWEGNNSIIPANRPNLVTPMYNTYVQWFGLLRSALSSFNNVKFVSMLDQVYGEAIGAGMDCQTALSAGHFTADGIHLNQALSNIYAKYIAGIFNI